MAGTPPANITDLRAHLASLAVPCEANVPLGPHTWYGTGGAADLLARPASIDQLRAVVLAARDRRLPLHVLGAGANLLVLDSGVRGVVVRLDHPGFATFDRPIGRNSTGETSGGVVVGAGHDLFKLVNTTARAGLTGIEPIAGIPGTLGGALRMNAGGAFGDIGSSVLSVTVMSHTGEVYTRTRDDLVFSYRHSNIDAPLILSAELALTEYDPAEVARRVKEVFFYKKASQPMGDHSAGCAFKNPPKDGPAEGRTAGQLIDQAGLKGHTIDGARVSPVHANFIVAAKDSGASADALFAVMRHVQRVVRDRFGVELQREVVVWGEVKP